MTKQCRRNWAVLPALMLAFVSCKEGEEKPSGQTKEVEGKKSVTEEAVQSAPPDEKPAAPPSPPPWADRKVGGSGFPCAVEEVLSTSCRRCHWEPQENDAPFPLVKWEDTQAVRSGKPIFVLMKQMVAAELMPPLDALVDPDVEPLTPEHKQVMLAWLEDGAKKSEELCK